MSEGVCGYSFSLELSPAPTTLAWTMRDSQQEAATAVQHMLDQPAAHMEEKTKKGKYIN